MSPDNDFPVPNLPKEVLEQPKSPWNPELTLKELKAQRHAIVELMESDIFQEGIHYGIPKGAPKGFDKKNLLQPGALLLAKRFGYVPEFRFMDVSKSQGHLTILMMCILKRNGVGAGQGIGASSTLEKRYHEKENTGAVVPKEYWDLRKDNPKKAQELLGGPGFSVGKVDGTWMIHTRTPPKNPAEHFNPMVKMAAKRALVAAVLLATASADFFTQDMELELDDHHPEEKKTTVAQAVGEWIQKPTAEDSMALRKSLVQKINRVKARSGMKKVYDEMEKAYNQKQLLKEDAAAVKEAYVARCEAIQNQEKLDSAET